MTNNQIHIIPGRESINDNYIELPESRLYVEKERTLFDKTFYETQEALHKDNSKMLTLNEFGEFLDVAKEKDTKLYNEITQVGTSWRAEWLDAGFKMRWKEMFVEYHIFKDGKIIKKSEKLDKDTLMKHKVPGIWIDLWLKDPTKQGLPSTLTEYGDLYYWAPNKNHDSVAAFFANPVSIYLNTTRIPFDKNSYLGVRVAKSLGGKI